MAEKYNLEDEHRIWKKKKKKNIYVIAKTPMAKTITERTLCGFKNYSTNIKYIENIVDDSKNDVDSEARKIKEEFNVMKFDVVVGNPPYQDNSYGANDSYAKPIYNLFMDLSYSLADISVLITPARFLFNAGSTPKKWNKKMLNNPHFKIVKYEAESKNIFPSTDIKGGVAISLFNKNEDYGGIKIFTKYEELNKLAKQFYSIKLQNSMSSIIYSKDSYHFTDSLLKDFPEVIEKTSKGHEKDVSSNIFSLLPEIFVNKSEVNREELIGIYGRENNDRVEKFIKSKYIREHDNLMSYKILMPGANGSGKFGEKITKPFIIGPRTGHTATFVSVGAFSTKFEAQNALKYIKTKFVRGILGILKVTPRNGATSWKLVPKQDFSENSDINWRESIKGIDRQLYQKYNLSNEEIDFIESNVQEMR